MRTRHSEPRTESDRDGGTEPPADPLPSQAQLPSSRKLPSLTLTWAPGALQTSSSLISGGTSHDSPKGSMPQPLGGGGSGYSRRPGSAPPSQSASLGRRGKFRPWAALSPGPSVGGWRKCKHLPPVTPGLWSLRRKTLLPKIVHPIPWPASSQLPMVSLGMNGGGGLVGDSLCPPTSPEVGLETENWGPCALPHAVGWGSLGHQSPSQVFFLRSTTPKHIWPGQVGL